MTTKILTSLKEALLGLLFPVKCVVCEKETGHVKKNKLICTNCLKSLAPSASLYCPLCEAKTIDGRLCFSCKLIAGDKFKLDRLLSLFSYKEPAVQKIIKAFKYHFIKDLGAPLGFLMVGYLEKIKENVGLNDLIVMPVPLHKRKFNQRGYNQSELLANQISKCLNIVLVKDCLIKERVTKDQASLKNEQRAENLNGVFKCLKPKLISDQKILLVDDVYTTGATMAECAKVLKKARVKEIIGLVIARG